MKRISENLRTLQKHRRVYRVPLSWRNFHAAPTVSVRKPCFSSKRGGDGLRRGSPLDPARRREPQATSHNSENMAMPTDDGSTRPQQFAEKGGFRADASMTQPFGLRTAARLLSDMQSGLRRGPPHFVTLLPQHRVQLICGNERITIGRLHHARRRQRRRERAGDCRRDEEPFFTVISDTQRTPAAAKGRHEEPRAGLEPATY